MKNFAFVKALLLLVLVVSFASCETESIADQESLILDEPIEDTEATEKGRIGNSTT
ncbi:MAG: hypothetical protein AAGA43_13520 [Bacteroidota bacterium]